MDNLYWLTQNSTEWDKYYIQTVNIDASSTNVWDTNVGFTPIGNVTTAFTGSYDGQGNTIDGLFINRPVEDYVGFIGRKNGPVKNLGITNVNITGKNSVGGLAGYAAGLVDNCSSSGTVTGIVGVGGLVGGIPDTNNGSSTTSNSHSTCDVYGFQSVGGLAGSNGDVVSNCYSTGIVTGGTGGRTGGLIGFTWYATTSSCYSESAVTSGGNNTGGLIGLNGSSNILNCYSTGSVNGVSYVGGLVGSHQNYNITNSYCIGFVSGSGSFVGGLVGDGGWGAHNSFWNTETTGQGISSGGIGATTLEMNSLCTYVDGVDAAWDFMLESLNGSSDVWGMNATVNDGYPFLAWQGFTHTAPTCALGIEKIENIKESNFYINNNTLYFKKTQNLTEINKVEVYNLLGQKVFKTSAIENQISFSALQNGVYLLIVKNKESQYAVLKFIIM
ncbi:MAG: T9SS type A sorting domain-containing protein [Flavobacteriaceae bacterium]